VGSGERERTETEGELVARGEAEREGVMLALRV
jgi:hypothetical protein